MSRKLKGNGQREANFDPACVSPAAQRVEDGVENDHGDESGTHGQVAPDLVQEAVILPETLFCTGAREIMVAVGLSYQRVSVELNVYQIY